MAEAEGEVKKKKDKSERTEGKKKGKKDKSEAEDRSEFTEGKKKVKKDKSEADDLGKEERKAKKLKVKKDEDTKDKQIGSVFGNEIDFEMNRIPSKKNEVERLRKSHYIREEKLKKLRKENASTEEVYKEMFAEDNDDKIEELEAEIAKLKKTLGKHKNMDTGSLPQEAVLQFENDWLEAHARQWKFKIDSLESKFEIVKQAHKNVVESLQKAHVQVTDQKEMENMRILLSNKKNDLYEATQLISELQKVAFSMLPPKVAKQCEEIEEAMTAARKKLEDISYNIYRMKMTMASERKEITALNTAVEGENEIYKIFNKKSDQKTNELNGLVKKLQDLDSTITNGFNILEAAGIVYEEAVAKAALMPLVVIEEAEKKEKKPKKVKKVKESGSDSEPKSQEAGPQRKSMTVAVIEKINFLYAKSDQIDKELAEAAAEVEKVNKDQLAIVNEMKKIQDVNTEIGKLRKTKDSLALQLQQEVVMRKTYYNQIEDLKGKIRVFSRCRPISKSEIDRGNVQCVSFPDKYTVAVHGVTKDGKPKEFQFDRVFPPETEQNDVFEDTSRLIQSAFDGFNVCIFAYGQTGSGKTHTLIGNLQTAPGIAPRSFVRLFEVVAEGKTKFSASLKCYMLELYNEKLLDLMANNAEYSDKLEIKKDQHGMVIVPGAELLPATSADELRDLFLKGNGNRHIASTKMNSESSRSHLIISIMIECVQHANSKIVRGKLSIIDLAGSERAAKSGVKGLGATEATAINMSLSALGDVISALTTGQPFVPYRNNKLTLLMQDSLGGNSKTLMFVNLSPVDYNATETVNSLIYAQRVKLIKNDATKVADTEEYPKLMEIIEKLQSGVKITDFQNIEAK